MKELSEFFNKYNIKPHNKTLYELAFTHSSFNSVANTHHRDYQRLEFMGDSVLGFVVASLIYVNHPELEEGMMSKMKASLVQSKSLAKKAREYGYLDYIRYGNSVNFEQISNNNHILEDIFEAVLGAIYLDQGINFVFKFITGCFGNDIINFDFNEIKDYKSILQEAMQAEFRESVTYVLVSEKGPSHDKTFITDVYFNGQNLGRGVGKSKKESEQQAAKEALTKVAK